jgi:hypothetical protein
VKELEWLVLVDEDVAHHPTIKFNQNRILKIKLWIGDRGIREARKNLFPFAEKRKKKLVSMGA